MAHELSGEALLKLISFIFWSSLYLACSLKAPHKSPEWCSRMVTLLHGSVSTIVGIAQCNVRTLSTYRLTMKCTPHQHMLKVWSWGYFAFDLLWCIIYWAEGPLILCHHTCALISITIYLQKQYTGCTFACTLALMEISNPFLQTRWFLRYEGYQTTLLYKIVEIIYISVFFIMRFIIGTYILCKVIPSDIFDRDEKIISIVLYLVSVGLLYDILGFVSYKYTIVIEKIKYFLNRWGIILNE